MDGLLTVSSTKHFKKQHEPLIIADERQHVAPPSFETIEDVLTILRSKPDFDNLSACLRWLETASKPGASFNIRVPSAKCSQLLHLLVNEILPNYWQVLRKGSNGGHDKERKLFIRSIRSVPGLGALVIRMRSVVAASKSQEQSKLAEPQDYAPLIRDMINVFEDLVEGSSFVLRLAKDIFTGTEKPIQQNLIWRELLSFVTSGRIISVVAEAESTLLEKGGESNSWVGDGKQYARWLGQNIRAFIADTDLQSDEALKFRGQLFTRSLSLGYNDHLLESMFEDAFKGYTVGLKQLETFFSALPRHEQTIVLYAIVRLIALSPGSKDSKESIGGIAALLHGIIGTTFASRMILGDWFMDNQSGSTSLDLNTHRAVMLVVSQDQSMLETVSSKLLSSFGDKVYIEHGPTLHQEVRTQDLLLAAGYLFNAENRLLNEFSKSSVYINAISNRLAASSPRAQFLGMVVGTAVSELADTPEMRMNFKIEELNSEEGKWYRGLIYTRDSIGSVEGLKKLRRPKTQGSKAPKKAAQSTPKQSQTSKVVAIEEVEDSETDDDDLPTYAKPDSDPEDSDEDPTLIQRNKPTAPVYIRDLIMGLRDTENYDRHKLALTTAADLIRRKANFGTEVSDHIEELATQLVGLGNPFNLDRFEEFRLRAMIAVIVAQPLLMGKWFSSTLFNGDYSMSVRAAILTALSMAARDLAGYREEDAPLTGAFTDPKNLFPSRRLPAKMERALAIGAAPVDALTEKMSQTMIRPMAAAAADKATGPDILKTRTFSSRMEVEKKRKRPITNELAKIVADGFFFPLTGRYRVHMQVYGSRSSFTTPFLLAHFLKTLALIMSASGSSTLSLPALTTEFWGFLLPLRIEAVKAKPVTESMLFCLMTILEINNNDLRQLAQDHAQELLETQQWAQQVFDNTRGGVPEEEKIRMLAAGLLVKCSEVVEKYQALLMGDLVNYM